METFDEQGEELGEEGSELVAARGGLQMLCYGKVQEFLLLFVVEEVLVLLLFVLLFGDSQEHVFKGWYRYAVAPCTYAVQIFIKLLEEGCKLVRKSVRDLEVHFIRDI